MKKLFSIFLMTLSLNAFTQTKDTILVKVAQILDISDTSRYATGVKAGKLRSKTRWQIDGYWCTNYQRTHQTRTSKPFITWMKRACL